jgi:translation initiation factor IF-3
VPAWRPFVFSKEGAYELEDDRDWALGLRPRRRIDQRPQEPQTRINDAIRVPQVRLIDNDGAQIGVKATDEALKYAWDKNLDLVEVAPEARPPVCRVMDYSKYRYEQEQKAKLARKHQSTITIKEIKLRPKIDPHDYATKKGHVVRFLKNRDKVKVTIMFRGREMTHPERGRVLLLKLAEEVQDLGVIESNPLQDGRNMVMMLAPHKNPVVTRPADALEDEQAENAEPTENAEQAENAEPAENVEQADPPAAEPEATEKQEPEKQEEKAPAMAEAQETE